VNAPDFRGDLVRDVPHSVEMEQSVLGAVLLENDSIDRLGELRAEHFFRFEHRVIFEAIQQMLLAARSVDVMTLFERLTATGQIEKTGGLAYLNALAGNTPGAANVARYAQIVVDRWKLRGILSAADEIRALVHERKGREVDEIVGEAQLKFERIAASHVSEPKLARDGLTELMTELDAQFHGAPSSATPTGFVDLDATLDGGMRGGELIVAAGRPSMGKTALALSIADHVATKTGPALIFSIEMPTKQLNMRNIARCGPLPLSRLKDGSKMQDGDWATVTRAVQHLADLALFIDDSSNVSLADISSRSRAIKRKHGLSLIVVDYLGLVRLGDEERHDLQIGAVTRGLKNLAKQLDVPVLLLSQLNRELEKRPNKRPQISDLRDSGSIEQDADVILFLYRDEVYNRDSPDRGIAEVNVAKQRNGSIGTIGLAFFGDNQRFADLASGTLFGRHETKPARRGIDD
jgi:replicative DNA helicase